MAVWSKNKVESSAINGGNEYEKKDRLSREQLNAITNNSFYASDTADEAKRIAENVEAGANSPVSYAPQVLLEAQKTQARENIGAFSEKDASTKANKESLNNLSMCPSENVTYQLLTNLPNLNTALFTASKNGFFSFEMQTTTAGSFGVFVKSQNGIDKILQNYNVAIGDVISFVFPMKAGDYIYVASTTGLTFSWGDYRFCEAEEV